MEAIEWIVLDYDAAENKVLLLSCYGIDSQKYHKGREDITWEKCSLRSWLNGEFLKAAFTDEEQQTILKTNVDNSKSQGSGEWDEDGGNDTVDQIFLLSNQEAFKTYIKDNESRICKPTAYAIAKGAKVSPSSGNGWWWLRSPGFDQTSAMSVYDFGSRYYNYVDYASGSIRPALWLNLDSGT